MEYTYWNEVKGKIHKKRESVIDVTTNGTRAIKKTNYALFLLFENEQYTFPVEMIITIWYDVEKLRQSNPHWVNADNMFDLMESQPIKNAYYQKSITSNGYKNLPKEIIEILQDFDNQEVNFNPKNYPEEIYF